MPRPKPLTCGGKGPCCHIGYAHRHCEHCDQVISLVQPYVYPTWPAWQPIYPTTYRFNVTQENLTAAAPFNSGNYALALESSWKDASAPEQVSHLCEVK